MSESAVPVVEPAYIRQNAFECSEEGEREFRAWIASCIEEAKAAGCTWPRWTWHEITPEQRVYVFEAWLKRPPHGAEGNARFAMSPTPAAASGTTGEAR